MRAADNRLKVIVPLLVVLTLVAACNLPAPQAPPLDLSGTAIAETVAANQRATPAVSPQPPPTTAPSPQPEGSPTTEAVSPTPSPTDQDADCNRVEFVDDVTVQDGTEYGPGASFTKTWRLRNAGTCPWTSEYALVFVDGDQMGGPVEMPLPSAVAPESSFDLSVNLTAPQDSGSYQGNWQLRDPDGVIFGIGEEADESFWVQIVVVIPTEDLDLGQATWRDGFDGALYWFLLDSSETKFSVEDGQLKMVSFNAGSFDEWGLSNRAASDDFYVEATVLTGASCSGQDRYGILFRAVEPTRTYVFSFACNGSYRLYRWDDGDFTALVGWTSASQILSGPNQTNRMGVLAEGNSLKLYANGKLIKSLSDSSFTQGRLGLFIGSAVTPNFTVFVQEVAFWDR
jgi:hypothetical protein